MPAELPGAVLRYLFRSLPFSPSRAMNDKADSMNRRSIQLVLGLLLATGFAQAQDTTPPMLLSAGNLIGADIGVCFSEAMDEFSIQNLAAYAVSDSSGTAEIAGVTTWPGNQAVVLHLSRPVTGPFTVRASDLYDLAFNSLPPGSVVTGRISTLGFESGTVGAPAGSAFLSCKADRLAVEGNDMFSDTSDQIEWLYVRRTNDFDVNVRVEQVSGPQSALPRCGLMVRGSSDPGSPMVRLIADATNQSWGVLFYIKRLRQDSERNGFWGEAVDYPVWLRIKRQRSLVSAYGSSNAVDWVRLGGPEPLRNLPPVVMIGLVTVTSEFGSATSATYCGFGDTRLWPEATIQLIQQPAPTTVEEHQTASFVARAEVSGAPAAELCFQWQAEGSPGSGTFTNIFLATAPRHTTTPLGPTDSGTGFRVIVSLSGGPKVISAPATGTVLPDRTGPRIVAARAANDLQAIILTFSEPLEPSAALEHLNYSAPGFEVGTPALNSVGEVVTLSLDHPLTLSNTYRVEVTSVADLAGRTIVPDPASVLVAMPVITRGFARRELYFDIPGSSLSDLRQAAKFPLSPDETSYVARLEAPHNAEDEYGVRLTGFLVPPVTGAYQ